MAMVQKQRAKNNLQAHRRDSYQSSTTSSSQHLSMRSMTSRRGSHLRESFLTATESSLNTLDEEDDSIDGDFYGELRRVDSIYHRSMSERHLQRSMQQLEAENERLRAERDAALLRTSATCAHMGINTNMNQSTSALAATTPAEGMQLRETSIRDYDSMPAIPAQASLRKLSNERHAYVHGKNMYPGRSSADAAAGRSMGHGGNMQDHQQGSNGDVSVQCVMSLKLELAELRTQYEELQHSQRLLQSQHPQDHPPTVKPMPAHPEPTMLRKNLDHPEDIELLQNRLRHINSQKAAMTKTMQRMNAEKKLVEVQLEAAQIEAAQYKARAHNMEQSLSDMSSRLSTMKDELEDTRRLLSEARQAAATSGAKPERRKSNDDLRSMVRRNKSLSLTGPGGLFGLCSASSTRSNDDIFNTTITSSSNQSLDDLVDGDECPRGRQSIRRGGRRPRRSRSLDPGAMGKAMDAILAQDMANAENVVQGAELEEDRFSSPPVPSTLTLSVQKVLKSHQASANENDKYHCSRSTADITSYTDLDTNGLDESTDFDNIAGEGRMLDSTTLDRPGSIMSLDRGDWIENVVSKAFSTEAEQNEFVHVDEFKVDPSNGSYESLGLEELPERNSSLNQAA